MCAAVSTWLLPKEGFGNHRLTTIENAHSDEWGVQPTLWAYPQCRAAGVVRTQHVPATSEGSHHIPRTLLKQPALSAGHRHLYDYPTPSHLELVSESASVQLKFTIHGDRSSPLAVARVVCRLDTIPQAHSGLTRPGSEQSFIDIESASKVGCSTQGVCRRQLPWHTAILALCPLGGHGTLCSFGGVLNPLWANRVCGVHRQLEPPSHLWVLSACGASGQSRQALGLVRYATTEPLARVVAPRGCWSRHLPSVQYLDSMRLPPPRSSIRRNQALAGPRSVPGCCLRGSVNPPQQQGWPRPLLRTTSSVCSHGCVSSGGPNREPPLLRAPIAPSS